MIAASDILAALAAAYASRQFYADSGTCTSSGLQLSFSTSFKRGFSFTFRFREASVLGPSLLQYTEGAATLKLPDPERPRSYSEFGSAVAAATGISFGTGHHIPRLLMPELVRGYSVCDLSDPVLLGRAPCHNIECQVVAGLHAESGVQYTLYIAAAPLLLFQILHDDFCVTYSPFEEHGAA